ncbi:MAG: hypothetical protein E7184_01160 [Erysipelotrichaceae bacterium]|nr:hypothetical protein [Erysipelotrichaceae bacterium]
MKEDKNIKSYKVLNVSLILFSFVFCSVFYKQWLLMIPLFIIGTRCNLTTLIFNTSLIYFFCLFTNWLNIILLSLCFFFYLIIYRLIMFFIDDEKFNYIIATFFVCSLLYRLQSPNVLLGLSYAFFSTAFVLVFDWIYESFVAYSRANDFFLEVVSIQLSAEKGANGDFFDTFEFDGCKYMILSDGMGQGEKAHRISKMIVSKIKNFIKRGYGIKNAIEMTNELLMIDEDVYASLDAVKCKDDVIEFYKRGAENSFLIKDGFVENINRYNLPMGIDDDSFRIEKRLVEPNDILLLCSDGVMLSYPNFVDELGKQKNENNLIKWIEKISVKTQNKVKDDFSIILIKFNEKREDL